MTTFSQLSARLSGAAWLAAALTLGTACTDDARGNGDDTGDPGTDNPAPDDPAVTAALKAKVKTIVVIYAENRGFDNMYGKYPGANGIPGLNPTATGTINPQLDRDGSKLAALPMSWGGVTSPGFTPAISEAMSAGLANAPYFLNTQYAGFGLTTVTRDLVHRFFNNQMQIDGGKNDKFTAFSDAGGLVMGYNDASPTALWEVAHRYVLADNFFMGAFGGSFLNHQYLICGCAPEYANADTSPAHPSIAVVDPDGHGGFTTNLTFVPGSAIDGPPAYAGDGNVTPKSYFGDGTFRAVNTMQPPYQPSANPPSATDTSATAKLYADPMRANTLPPQTGTTIGDVLDAQSITWKWYAGQYATTLATATGDRVFQQVTTPGGGTDYQFHHQPFNFYAKLDPANTAYRQAHLDDGAKLLADAAAGTLPQVVFYKPSGEVNEHSGYTSITAGDKHMADLIAKLEASPQFANMIIVLTYDENGGWWDHVAPPKADLLGPGNRTPALIISPLAKSGTVDHTQYDTASVQRLINRRFDLTPLPGIVARDKALVAAGGKPMGDLTNALNLK